MFVYKMATTITWNNDLIFTLICMYEKRRLLWDTSSPEYKDKLKKHEAWVEIAKHFNSDRETVERKMKILITQFRREVIKTGDDTKWFAYKKLLFLKSRLEKPSFTFVQYDSNLSHIVKGEDITIEQHDSLTEQPASTTEQPASITEQPISVIEQPITYKRPRPPELDAKTDEMYRLVKEIHSERQSKDEFTVFGEHVALKLRKLNNLYARCTAQYHINNILYKAEVGEYDVLDDGP